jgi:oxygen-independent coproporphyrinogen-3 oxidase
MFGIWGEDIASWKKELVEAVKLPADHVSCYELTYENGTPLFAALKNKSVTPLEDDVTAAMYELVIDELGLRGIKQYEVSNFAKIGCECKHNINYWENNEYIGLGPSAVSYIEGVRAKNISDVGEYVKRLNEGKSIIESSEHLTPVKRARETAAIKIRTKEGIDFKWFKDKTGFDLQELEKNAIKDLLAKDLIKYKRENNLPSGIVLKRKGFLFCDTVSSAMM